MKVDGYDERRVLTTSQPLYSWKTLDKEVLGSLVFFDEVSGDFEATNIELPNQMPAGKSFLVEGVEVVVKTELLRDLNLLMSSGSLELYVASARYLVDTPLGVFTPKWESGARINGVYAVQPGVDIKPGSNFYVVIAWKKRLELSASAALGVRLHGWLSRTEV